MPTGTKLLVSGAVCAVSAALLHFLIGAGQLPDPVKPPGFPVALPAPIAITVLSVISGAVGWAGWSYFRQAERLMVRLEFEMGVHPNEIKAALTGSSLASTNTLLLKSLCLITFIALTVSHSEIYFLLYFHKVFPRFFVYVIVFVLPIMLPLPYFLLAFLSPRMRYFKPENWNRAKWLFRILLKGIRDEFCDFYTYAQNYQPISFRMQLPEQISQKDGRRLYGDLAESIPEVISTSVNTIFRKLGFKILIRWRKFDEMFEEEMWQTLDRVADEILLKKLPDADQEIRAALKEYFMALLYRQII